MDRRHEIARLEAAAARCEADAGRVSFLPHRQRLMELAAQYRAQAALIARRLESRRL